jgi:glycosyltransferase involved in cell wall biosynthesis
MIPAGIKRMAARLGSSRPIRPGGPLKMSVVVAVYNPGPYFEACASSLLNQSMHQSEYEVVFVDDGSSDGTERRMDDLAATHANVRVIHLPNSGWPGRPRNVGLDAALGEYVYLVDHDDWLAPEALERVHAMGRRNRADVVIGRIEGHGRVVPSTLFTATHETCDLTTAPLMESMTPHKAFRRDFLDLHGLRFPEGRRRLEDHLFVVEAYLRAEVVSVLSDYTCYHHIRRDDGANAAYRELDPDGYFANLRECVDTAEALTEEADVRDLVLRRWYTVEMLGRVGGRSFLDYPVPYRREMVRAVRELALERFTSPRILRPCEPHVLLRAALLRSGDVEALERLAELEVSLYMEVDVRSLSAVDGRLHVDALVGIRAGQGAPALVATPDGEVSLAGFGDVDVEPSLGSRVPIAMVVLRHRTTHEHRFVACAVEVERCAIDGTSGEAPDQPRLRVSGTVDLGRPDGEPLSAGTWDLFLRMSEGILARRLTTRLAAEPAAVAGEPEPAEAAGDQALLYTTAAGNASVRV